MAPNALVDSFLQQSEKCGTERVKTNRTRDSSDVEFVACVVVSLVPWLPRQRQPWQPPLDPAATEGPRSTTSRQLAQKPKLKTNKSMSPVHKTTEYAR